MKSSKYNILLEHKGKKLAFNSRTASFAEIDENFLRILNNIDKLKLEELSAEDKKLVEDMKSGCYVIEDDVDELKLLKLTNFMGKLNVRNGFNFTIAPTLQCNFACPYCFEERQIGMMSQEVQDFIIKKVEEEASLKNDVSIVWYGGEPLLAKHIIEDMSRRMISVAEKHGVRYSAGIVTNGYLLDEVVVKILKDAKVNHAQITLDGPPEIHDSRRKLHSGGKTFDRIIKNIKLMLEVEIPVTIRVNIDKTNVNKFEDLIVILKSHGLQKCDISIGHVRSDTQACSSIEYSCLSGSEYAKEALRYQYIISKYGFGQGHENSYYPFVKTNYCCADTVNCCVVGPDGTLYRCWADVGNKTRQIGNIKLSLKKFNKVNLDYIMWSPFDYKKCVECKVLPICMGGCPYHGLLYGKPECEKWVYNLEDVLKVKYDLFLQNISKGGEK